MDEISVVPSASLTLYVAARFLSGQDDWGHPWQNDTVLGARATMAEAMALAEADAGKCFGWDRPDGAARMEYGEDARVMVGHRRFEPTGCWLVKPCAVAVPCDVLRAALDVAP